jgi:hypothetical protein
MANRTTRVEALGIMFRSDTIIQGFKIKAKDNIKNIVISQYADDSVICLENTNQIKLAIDKLEIFGKVSGLILNKKKTKVLLLGRQKYECPDLEEITKIEVIKFLGIYIGHNKKVCENKNWEENINNMSDILESWSKRDLTMLGKVTIIKSLAISKLLYSAINTFTPNWVINKINTLLYKFLWNSSEKIKRVTLIKP